MSALCLAGSYFDTSLRIPDNKTLLDHVIRQQWNGKNKNETNYSIMEPDFLELCTMYEEYLFVQVHTAICQVLQKPEVYKKHRFIRVHVDLLNEGLVLSDGTMMPFHIAHYGIQRIDPETKSYYWSRRYKNSWMVNGVPVHPFRYAQGKLAQVGYHLVDMSFMGIDPHFRLYYRGYPPSNKDYFDHVHRRHRTLTQDKWDAKHYYWHGMHTCIPINLVQ